MLEQAIPRRFIHFCGHSGVGKKSLMKKLCDDSVPGLRVRFGIDRPFGTYGAVDHPTAKPLYAYPFATEDIVLHHWQFVSHGWIAHNLRVYPEAEQRVFLLWQPYALHCEYLAGRKNGWEPGPEEERRLWNTQIVPLFRQVQSWGLPVEVVNASTPFYDLMPDWPS